MVLLSLKPIPFLPKAMEMLFDKSLLGLIESSLHLLRSRLRLFLVVPPPVSSPLIPRRGEPVRNWNRTLISAVFWKTSSIWSKYWSAVRYVCLDSDRSLCWRMSTRNELNREMASWSRTTGSICSVSAQALKKTQNLTNCMWFRRVSLEWYCSI